MKKLLALLVVAGFLVGTIGCTGGTTTGGTPPRASTPGGSGMPTHPSKATGGDHKATEATKATEAAKSTEATKSTEAKKSTEATKSTEKKSTEK